MRSEIEKVAIEIGYVGTQGAYPYTQVCAAPCNILILLLICNFRPRHKITQFQWVAEMRVRVWV